MKILNEMKGLGDVSRRGFLKGTAALGTSAVLYGCSKDDGGEAYSYTPVVVTPGGDGSGPSNVHYVYGTTAHNCGGKCVSKAEVSNGRIIRILGDDTTQAWDGTPLTTETRNMPQTRGCAKCRAYKYRVYHPGRLKYPMKQTKKRGDLTGFVRLTWEQAVTEIATKHSRVLDKWGPHAIYNIYATGAGSPSSSQGMTRANRYMGGIQTSNFGSYSTHQHRYFGVGYTGINGNGLMPNMCAKYANTLVMWGDNSISTAQNGVFARVKLAEDMKNRNPNSKQIYIGPEFSDGAVTIVDEWFVTKPFTDPALIAGMIYHMLDNTFNLADGSLRAEPWLDIDYLDTMVYGFFDSPAYSLNDTTGVIGATGAGDRDIQAVSGRSYCSWILGNNANGKAYSAADTNYTAVSYAALGSTKRWAPCSYDVKGVAYTDSNAASSKYKTKQDYRTPKTPAWAAAITGLPEDAIKRLAQIYCDPANSPIATLWSGGQQKQAEGIANLFSVQALQIITKNAALYGTGWGRNQSTSVTQPPAVYTLANPIGAAQDVPAQQRSPVASCTAWHTTIKAAFASELVANGYRAKYIPNWPAANNGTLATGDFDIYWDDAGSKAAAVMWKRYKAGDPEVIATPSLEGTVRQYMGPDSLMYYDWEGRTGTDGAPDAHAGTPKYCGIRLLYNNGGGIFINQHENSNDSREMLEYLNKCNYDDADTFCMVTTDNFLSPSTRWSDYILPNSTSWEHHNYMTPGSSRGIYIPIATPPPGEALTSWIIGQKLLDAWGKVRGEPSRATDYTGGVAGRSIEEWARTAYYNGPYKEVSSPFYQKSFEEYVKKPFLASKPNDEASDNPAGRLTVDNYKALDATGKLAPFIKNVANFKIETNRWNWLAPTGGDPNYPPEFADASDAPVPSFRYQLYCPLLPWHYEHRYTKWHGFVPAELRGQPHKDIEGDRFVIEIPIYMAYEDYFMEAYGNDPAKLNDLKFLLTTTHDRYRSHSSTAENPLTRELNHRVPGRNEKGRFKPGNDYNYYSMGPVTFNVNGGGTYPPLGGAIEPDGTVTPENKEIASYTEIWMNEADGIDMGLLDGDLIQVENPVGAVRCVARLTKRCARGFVSLHQGCWYDPRPLPNSYNHDNVDVGGNCNTLMASQPSRQDHGNGQQSAMVKIVKVTDY